MQIGDNDMDNRVDKNKRLMPLWHQPFFRFSGNFNGETLADSRDYSFPGSSWERIVVEAPAYRVHKLKDAFRRGGASLALSYQAEPGYKIANRKKAISATS